MNLPFLLLSALLIYFSCKRQDTSTQEVNTIAPHLQQKPLGKIADEMESRILQIFQDSEGDYWFGSGSQGVYKYDGKQLIQYTTEDGLSGKGVWDIQQDHMGHLYFGTGDSISKFDGQQFETLPLINDQTGAWQLQPNDLWFSCRWNNSGAYRYDGKYLYHLKFPKHPLEEEAYAINPNMSFSPYEVYVTQKDSKGNIWFGTSVFGACRYDGTSHLWVSEREMTEIDLGPAPGVRSILEDRNGHFWFSSNFNHKYKIFGPPEKLEAAGLPYQKIAGIDHSSVAGMNNFCMAFVQDEDEDIWMATYTSGVWRYDGKQIHHYPVSVGKKEAEIFTIYKDKAGGLWLGTHNVGALKFDGQRFVPFDF